MAYSMKAFINGDNVWQPAVIWPKSMASGINQPGVMASAML